MLEYFNYVNHFELSPCHVLAATFNEHEAVTFNEHQFVNVLLPWSSLVAG